MAHKINFLLFSALQDLHHLGFETHSWHHTSKKSEPVMKSPEKNTLNNLEAYLLGLQNMSF